MPDVDAENFPCRRGIPDERRIVCAAFGMWDRIRGQGNLPLLSGFRADRFPNVAPFTYLVHLEPELEQSRFVASSPVLEHAFGAPIMDRTLKEALPHDYREQFLSYSAGVVMYRKPLTESGGFFGHGGVEVLYRNIIMPVADSEDNLTHLLGAFNFILVR